MFSSYFHRIQLADVISKGYNVLNEIFTTFANLRQPRTAALVKVACAQRESRVIDGGHEACAERDQKLRKSWGNEVAVESKYNALFKEPF